MRKHAIPAAMVLLAPGPAVAAEPSLPDWMTGCWTERRGERWTDECWMAPRAGLMLGASRSGAGDRVSEWEALRIETTTPDGIRMAYRASPNGNGWTTFAWSPSGDGGVTFFNLANDYPQRIRYWREGRRLIAEIALSDGSRARRWTYEPARR